MDSSSGFAPIYFISVVFIGYHLIVQLLTAAVSNALSDEIRQYENTIAAVTPQSQNSSNTTSRAPSVVNVAGTVPSSSTPKSPETATIPYIHPIFNKLADSKWFKKLMMLATLGNSIVFTAIYKDMPPDYAKSLNITDSVFLGIFCFEVIIKVLAIGPQKYILRMSNALDFIMTILGIIQKFLPMYPGIQAFRNLRTVRIIELFRFFPSLTRLKKVITVS